MERLIPLVLCLIIASCKQHQSMAAEPVVKAAQREAQKATIPKVLTFMLPNGMKYHHGEYASRYGGQYYNMVRATWSNDEDEGLLSIDVSPSHPRLWQRPLSEHGQNRLKALARIGKVSELTYEAQVPEITYEAYERYVDVAGEVRSVFRIFRQKSRVVTIAYTAAPKNFDSKIAHQIVQNTSNRLLIHMPVVRYEKPVLTTTVRQIGHITSPLPSDWIVSTHRAEATTLHAETIELSPTSIAGEEIPTLTLSLVRMPGVDGELHVESIELPPDVREIVPQTATGAHATVLDLGDNTLAALRVVHLGSNLVTVNYAAPDYLFETKDALNLLEQIAQAIKVTP